MKYIKAVIIPAFLMLALIGVGLNIHDARMAHASPPSTFAPIACDGFKPFSVSANTQLVTAGNANMFIYVCSFIAGNDNAGAGVFSFVEGTGATCGSNTLAVIGNNTAAGGLPLPITGNVNSGSGVGAITKTAVAGDNLCIFTAAGPIAGELSWTSAPY